MKRSAGYRYAALRSNAGLHVTIESLTIRPAGYSDLWSPPSTHSFLPVAPSLHSSRTRDWVCPPCGPPPLLFGCLLWSCSWYTPCAFFCARAPSVRSNRCVLSRRARSPRARRSLARSPFHRLRRYAARLQTAEELALQTERASILSQMAQVRLNPRFRRRAKPPPPPPPPPSAPALLAASPAALATASRS